MHELVQHPHRRFNPLTGEWLLVSPHRTKRPWQGQIERVPQAVLPAYDRECYLCPGNKRAGDRVNPDYRGVFVFDNDFAALTHDFEPEKVDLGGLLIAEGERGMSRVMCFSPDHSLALSRMDVAAIGRVVDEWARQFTELGALEFVSHVQIFENRGEMMGCSNPHPHCQIWASESVPNESSVEIDNQTKYLSGRGSCLLCDYLALEILRGERIVRENEGFAALVPFWAIYPFEIMILPKRHCGALPDLDAKERLDLADILKQVTLRYDNLFEVPFPYSMGFHQKPTDGKGYDAVHLHAHFFPPLLRSATVRKFLVGFELLGSPQRDFTPETAAERLRAVSATHYLDIVK